MSAAGVDVVVSGGRVVTWTEVIDTSVAIKGGRTVALAASAPLPRADRVIDATGKYVLPGLIDCHLHVGPEYDDWRTAPLAAARTGLTTLLPFVVYDDGESVPAAVKRLREEAEALSVLDFGMHMILNHEPHVLDGLAEAVTLGASALTPGASGCGPRRARSTACSPTRRWSAGDRSPRSARRCVPPVALTATRSGAASSTATSPRSRATTRRACRRPRSPDARTSSWIRRADRSRSARHRSRRSCH